ncbi:MAG: hypothetical protein J0M22_07615 [Gammaproteobacteria bacterium]|nr:hypothetical protein [Gammaproteobacteria bacterium]
MRGLKSQDDQISQWQNAIYSRQNEISNEQGNANQDCSMSTLGAVCSGQVFPDTNLGCSAITGDNPALKLCGRLWL